MSAEVSDLLKREHAWEKYLAGLAGREFGISPRFARHFAARALRKFDASLPEPIRAHLVVRWVFAHRQRIVRASQ